MKKYLALTTLLATCVCLAAKGVNLTLLWDGPTDGQTTGYEVWQSLGTNAFARIATSTTNSPSVTFTNVALGQYRWYVVATNGFGSSAPSTTVSFTAAVPIAPGNVRYILISVP